MKKATKIAATAGAAAVLVAAGAIGMNVLAGSKSTPAPSAHVAAHRHAHRRLPGGLRKLLGQGGVVVRGTVSAITSSSVTIVEAGGHSVTARIGPSTRFYGLSVAAAGKDLSTRRVRGLMVESRGEAAGLVLRSRSGAAGASVA